MKSESPNDYNAKLTEDYTEIKRRVERGMLPLVARNPAIEKATTEYALARADHYHAEQAKGKTPPIPFKDSAALEKYADLILYEELKWSHPDKMTIVEYPVMSDWQEDLREEKYTHKPEIKYGDMRYKGRRKIAQDNKYEAHNVSSRRIFCANDDGLSDVDTKIIVQDSLNNAGLTDRQFQAINLIFFENMTQEEAAREMGVHRRVAVRHMEAGLSKLREYLTKNRRIFN